ncbi:twisted gastrulation protein homolog 1-A-like [Mizuhopecten yessoensis]|uniref:twisted gastrulation protein homolog 1-A-like n=1 Tax=Mizuhopecten yessoensis TaxID=6573 RepID=UPI000B459085|nr:twisted gastrulation protein homolog 1-A-like [Mizuhopecten yessoensis]
MKGCVLFCVTLVTVFGSLCLVDACNEAICGPIVSKCILIDACSCDFGNFTNSRCLKNCTVCLDSLFMDCCACVGLCKPKDTEEGMDDSSSVEELREPLPELFNVLTEEEDLLARWKSFTYPASAAKPGKNILLIKGKRERTKPEYQEDTNCTVAFMSECSAMQKCKDACRSMGASQYRWFHDHGCCQCVGHTCLNYGLNKPRCSNCPPPDEIDDIEQEEKMVQEMNRIDDQVMEMEEEINDEFDEFDDDDDDDGDDVDDDDENPEVDSQG